MSYKRKLVNWGSEAELYTNFQDYDGGRSKSRYKKEYDDCTVRAMAVACSISYNKSYTYLQSLGRKKNTGFNLHDILEECDINNDVVFGYNITNYKFKQYKTKERMYIAAFSRLNPIGIYILNCLYHVVAVKNGIVYDELNGYNPKFVVLSAFEFTQSQ